MLTLLPLLISLETFPEKSTAVRRFPPQTNYFANVCVLDSS